MPACAKFHAFITKTAQLLCIFQARNPYIYCIHSFLRHFSAYILGLGNITINHKYRQTSVCNINIACIFLLQYYHKDNIITLCNINCTK